MSNTSCKEWKEIHGFKTPGKYRQFLEYLEKLKDDGQIEEISVDPDYHKGLIYGGKWFKCNLTGEVWRLVPPDMPLKDYGNQLNFKI
jgi:hypothetical protein